MLGCCFASTLCPRFIRRGRSSGQADSDLDIEFNSDEEEDVMRDWLDAPGKGPIWDMVASEKKVAKYLDPGTVSDLYQHYVATRQMWGAAAVSCPDMCHFDTVLFYVSMANGCMLAHTSPRYGTFLSVYNARWRDILKFRHQSSTPI